MKFKVVTNNSRQIDLNWDMINVYLSRYKPGTPIDVEIVRRVRRKSTPMRKWYFGAVLPTLMEHVGYEPHEKDELHRYLKIKHFGVEPDKKLGIHRDKDIPHVFLEDSDSNVQRQKQFLDWVLRVAAKQGCYIEDPRR